VPVVTGEQRDEVGHGGYRHEAFFYADRDEFMDGTLGFVRDSVAAEEPILVVLSAAKLDALQAELGKDADRVLFADMDEVGTNPARIIPAWQDFISHHASDDRRMRGVGEPIWAARSPAEMAECQRHEALLNVAFADPAFWLLCPYDTSALDERVVEAARRNHPFVREPFGPAVSASFPGVDALVVPFDDPLPAPPADAVFAPFDEQTLVDARALVGVYAQRAGLTQARAGALVLAVHEVAANSIAHGGGQGTLGVWHDPSGVVCEVRDRGGVMDPLAGRKRPGLNNEGGRGLWIANQLCELVQLRSFGTETVVRLHVRLT
jgi:anti-sigma regulatory factor (Ser/Thr protein kinase)